MRSDNTISEIMIFFAHWELQIRREKLGHLFDHGSQTTIKRSNVNPTIVQQASNIITWFEYL